jgi:myo-inositol-1(or 4)-monophosphatase
MDWRLAVSDANAADLRLLIDAARAAGAELRARFGTTQQRWAKENKSPVTEADYAANAILKETLRSARPDYGWLSEEDVDGPERLDAHRVFIVDPLDGTRSFIHGRDDFCTALAIVEDGVAIAGAIYRPMTDHIYAGGPGLGAQLNGAPIAPSTQDAIENCIMVGDHDLSRSKKWREFWPPVRVRAVHAFQLRLAFIASSEGDATIGFGAKWDWDVAAGAAIITGAGGRITDPWGRALKFNHKSAKTPGVVASGARLHPLLIKHAASLPFLNA